MKILKSYETHHYSVRVVKTEEHTEEIIDSKPMKTTETDPIMSMHKKHDDPNAIYEKKNVDSGFTGLNFGITVSRGY
jgi:hypothetical protein